jgi:predicted transcriptional regulator YdeE
MSDRTRSLTSGVPPITAILPFENRLRVFTIPKIRFIGRSIRDTLYSDPNPCPAFWSAYYREGHHLLTDALPHVIPNTMAWSGEFNPETNGYTYLICVACPADTPVPDGLEYRDAPAAYVGHGRIGETPGEAYSVQGYDEPLARLGFLREDEGWGEFYPHLGTVTFCLLFTCRPLEAPRDDRSGRSG